MKAVCCVRVSVSFSVAQRHGAVPGEAGPTAEVHPGHCLMMRQHVKAGKGRQREAPCAYKELVPCAKEVNQVGW